MGDTLKAAIFDLDGVLVDTARLHYFGWRHVADKLGIPFDEAANERFKGVSRGECMEMLLSLGNRTAGREEKERLSGEKNSVYLSLVAEMDERDLLEGAKDFVEALRGAGIRTAVASSSRNAGLILERTGIRGLFDVVVDGTMIARSKPDPEVFSRAAGLLGVAPGECVVFEDATAGIVAARAAGMRAIGVGLRGSFPDADFVVAGLREATLGLLARDLPGRR